ncbi:IS200/IS605 family transposase [Lyngbya sp. PCC 8106]|uniref:IS200/IS605 family transposase n=1 Tax=Lyngbya sp. (strain PCC 8106) TaxID=313612 RepID=UPI0000EAC832|nr:IS200/IS605 family transposase [Lyngbya sp. PCC 8106]EAW38653.1 transposase [Lyngbya sp. PCC 8106]
MVVRSSARSVSDVRVHLVLVTKFRRKVFVGNMLLLIEATISKVLENNDCELIEFNGEVDHIHVLFQYLPQQQLSKLVNTIKTATSRTISSKFESELKKVYSGKKVLWSSSYYVSSCGGVAVDRLKEYIKEQDRPS